jgi:serine/threonine protein kinase
MGFANLHFVRELGRGAFGSVVLAVDADSKQLVAVKKLPRASVQSRYTESELINHRLVPRLLLSLLCWTLPSRQHPLAGNLKLLGADDVQHVTCSSQRDWHCSFYHNRLTAMQPAQL